jgi:predicted Zn finger-like uncharacterized protein
MSGLDGKQRPAVVEGAPEGERRMPLTSAKATASATIEAIGSRMALPRNHSIKVALRLSSGDARHADKAHLRDAARRSLDGFPPARDQPDRREYGDLALTGEWNKNGSASVVVGVEGSVVWPGRPADAAVEQLRASLVADGYRVTVRERRECAEAACSGFAMVGWNQPTQIPAGWYTQSICGKHNYKACPRCRSTYVMTSSSSAGQAPSVRCQVCGEIMVAWGSSKVWEAQLISRRDDRA